MSTPSTPRTSIPGTTRTNSIHLPPPIPLPSPQASTEAVRAWILAWHASYGVSVSAYTLSRISWTVVWIHEQPPAQLESEIFPWGVPEGRGRMMLLDLVRERREVVGLRQKKWSEKVSNAMLYPVVMKLLRIPTASKRGK